MTQFLFVIRETFSGWKMSFVLIIRVNDSGQRRPVPPCKSSRSSAGVSAGLEGGGAAGGRGAHAHSNERVKVSECLLPGKNDT